MKTLTICPQDVSKVKKARILITIAADIPDVLAQIFFYFHIYFFYN